MKTAILKYLENKINELDKNYQTLRDGAGYLDPDVQYVKGHRDALVNLYNDLK